MRELAIEWCRSEDLTPAEVRKVALWIRVLDAEFYSLFQLGNEKIQQLIAQLLFHPLSEFSPTLLVRQAGVLAGLVTWFPANEMFARRIFVLKELLAATADAASIKTRLHSFEGASRKVPLDTLYLSKIYVASESRGCGLGRCLFLRFLEKSKALACYPILHVRHDNDPAIALYEKHGFSVVNLKTESPYCLMEKRL